MVVLILEHVRQMELGQNHLYVKVSKYNYSVLCGQIEFSLIMYD